MNKDCPFESEKVESVIEEDGTANWYCYTRDGIEKIGPELCMQAKHYRNGTEVIVTEFDG